jgi:hypothetical protein
VADELCFARIIATATRAVGRIGADLSAVAQRAKAEGVIRRSPSTKRRVTPEPAIGPRFARTRWAYNAPYVLAVRARPSGEVELRCT